MLSARAAAAFMPVCYEVICYAHALLIFRREPPRRRRQLFLASAAVATFTTSSRLALYRRFSHILITAAILLPFRERRYLPLKRAMRCLPVVFPPSREYYGTAVWFRRERRCCCWLFRQRCAMP